MWKQILCFYPGSIHHLNIVLSYQCIFYNSYMIFIFGGLNIFCRYSYLRELNNRSSKFCAKLQVEELSFETDCLSFLSNSYAYGNMYRSMFSINIVIYIVIWKLLFGNLMFILSLWNTLAGNVHFVKCFSTLSKFH